MFTPNNALAGLILVLVTFTVGTREAMADNWTMAITVDNRYDIYFADAFFGGSTFVGGDTDWMDTENWSITGVPSTNYLYVATASDHSTAQGFIGTFTNTTTGNTFETSDDVTSPWEVFPAGQYLFDLNGIDGTIPATVWPASTQPTSSQVLTAVAYAETNNLWIDPVSATGYTNGATALPWGGRPGIPATAEWIWHDTGAGTSSPYPAPFDGFNHDEFLVFRIAGNAVPEPSSFLLFLFSMTALIFMALYRRTSTCA